MRTKTLLLTAVLGVASIVAALAADPVYSVNAVGYVNVVLKPGFTIVANPLNAGDNHLSKIFPANMPSGTTIYRQVDNKFVMSAFIPDDFGVLNWDIVPTPAVGEGFWIKSKTAKTWNRTFTVNP